MRQTWLKAPHSTAAVALLMTVAIEKELRVGPSSFLPFFAPQKCGKKKLKLFITIRGKLFGPSSPPNDDDNDTTATRRLQTSENESGQVTTNAHVLYNVVIIGEQLTAKV